MSDPRVNELRAILRANSPQTPDLATPIREAVDRQASVLRANQEVGDGLDRLFRRLGPPANRTTDSEEYDRG